MSEGIIDMISLDDIKSMHTTNFNKVSVKDIAVIGISAKFPCVDGLDEFWRKLVEGADFIGQIPEPRKKDIENYFDFIGFKKDKRKFEEAAYLQDIDKFDYSFFNLSPNEAALMDPNQRLFLETAWQAIEDAGYGGTRIIGSRTAVFVGFSNESEYRKIIYDAAPDLYPISIPGNLPPIIASRISFLLDLKGPSMVINTTCSSSLVALHLGCQALRNNECSMAIIGGVQIHVLPVRQVEIGIESSNRRTRSFDYSSDGTGGGEGVTAVLLKPLDKAIVDGDNIYAIIKGSAYNQDGASVGISAPNPASQEEVIVRAWQEAGIDPNTISYIEAHGTGTKLGDPIEIDGVQRAFRRYTDRKQFCAIGSVKSNIGHLDASAGLAGFLKAVLALQNRQIPPSLHFERPNRAIAFHKSPVYVNRKLREWKKNDFPRRCGVSSFGFSGTNCHVILEEPPVREQISDSKGSRYQVLTISAKTEEALLALVNMYSRLDYNGLDLKNICYTANTGRGHYNHRIALLLEDLSDLNVMLKELTTLGLNNKKIENVYYGKHKIIDSSISIKGKGDITSREKEILQSKADNILAEAHSEGDIDKSTLEKISDLYVMGAEIEWDDLYRFEQRRKVRLPVYPFERKRCWVSIPNTAKDDYGNCFFTQEWRLKKLEQVDDIKRNGTTLVFGNSKKGLEIVEELIKKGRDVIEVRISDVYKKISDKLYYINNEESDYERLIADIKSSELTQIIHLLALGDAADTTINGLEKRLSCGLYSFFHITKEIIKEDFHEVDIVLVAQYADKVDTSEKIILPENAALFGLGKVVNVEEFRLKCRCIDIDDDASVHNIISEIESGYQDYNVAYRNGNRYIQELTEIKLENLENREIKIKEDGVYVITGGMGGLGLEIASYISSKAKVKLLLINRTKYPEREQWRNIITDSQDAKLTDKLRKLMDIEKSGSEIELVESDITISAAVSATFDRIRSKFKKIDGIIHCAGIGVGSQGEVLRKEDFNRFLHVISPKIHGTYFIDKETRNDKLDFFVVFSSPITITGGIGSGSYTAANLYLNSFSASRNMINVNTKTMSWAPWEKTVESSKMGFTKNKHMFEVISANEIVNAFEQLLNKDIELAVVGKLNYSSDLFYLDGLLPFRLSSDLKSRIEGYKNKVKQEPSIQSVAPKNVALRGRDNGIYTDSEKITAAIWGQVLGYNELNIYDNFYELGGDSIIAMKVINNVNQFESINLKVVDLLSNLTIKQMAACIDKYKNKSKNKEYSLIERAEKRDCYPVSMSQKRIFLLSNKRKGDISWNMSWVFVVKGELDVEQFERSFRQLVKRHDVFRTSFRLIKGKPVQLIDDDLTFNIMYQELNGRAIDQLAKEFIKPFDLSQTPLLRVGLVRIIDKEYLLLFDIHHIIADAASIQVLLNEVMNHYRGVQLPELPIQYKDFSMWQNNLLSGGAYKKQQEYWMKKFGDDIPVLNLPLDYPRKENGHLEGDRINFEIDEDMTYKLNRLAGKTGTSLFVVLLSAFYILIWKFSSQKDITIGVPISGRTHNSLESLIGMFVNVIVVKSSLNGGKTFAELLAEVKDDFLKSYVNSEFPFIELVNKLGIIIDANRNPLFDISFVMQNTGNQEIDMGNGLIFTPYKYENLVSRNDILIEAVETESKIGFIFEYNTSLFKRNTINGLRDSYIKIIKAICNNYFIRLSEIETISLEQKLVMLDDFNENLEIEL